MAKNEVAVMNENFNLVTLSGELGEAIAEEMDGLGTIPFDRVKIPSGGGLAFEIPGEDENNPESATEIVGVILYHHPVNAYWKEKFEGGNEQPDCSSYDGKQGVEKETGECKDCSECPFNEFGSGENGAGKACKNMHRIYIVREGNPVPLIVTLPPTSIKSMRDYIGKSIVLKGMRSYDAVTKITLKKEKNATGINYSRAVFTFAGKLAPEKAAEAKAMAESIKQTSKNIDIDTEDYETAPAAPTDAEGFMSVPEGDGEPLPFN